MNTTPLAAGWTCPSCALDNVAATEGEAALLAGIHDRFMHRGAPTAQLRRPEAADA